jgi:tetratricopeptide (TPR) repeat protein
MSISRRVSLVAALVLVVSLVGSALSVRRVDALRGQATLEEVLYISSPQALRRLSLGYTGLMASIYWTRAVQYFGARHLVRSDRYDLLLPLLQITTELDPHLLPAYKFGSIFLSQQPPEGAGLPDQAVELVERGIRANPHEWQLYYYLGFIHYLERDDYAAAADAFLRGSEMPGAHPWLRIMAAAMAQHGGDIATARYLWTNIYQHSDDQLIRANAVRRLRALQVDEEVPQLEAMVEEYRRRSGQLPGSFRELVEAGWLRALPVDPTGRPYRLMPGGRVEVESPKDLPFIRRGLPPGQEPSFLVLPESKEKKEETSQKQEAKKEEAEDPRR